MQPEMPPHSITIQTGARLHFGPLSFRPERGRHFGGIGLMIKDPGFRVAASLSDSDQITADPQRAMDFIDSIRSLRRDWNQGLKIKITSVIPPHRGLGSGTQLGMALSEAIARLHGLSELSAEEIAKLAHRGKRSSIGLHGYLSGGFLIDAGHSPEDQVSPLACGFSFPEDWPILLVTPPSTEGVSGASEASTFQQLGSMPQTRTGELCRLALTEIVPAIQSNDFDSFASSIREYGTLVGEFFREHQGGVFSHSEMESLAGRLAVDGIDAVAQTSWGPTVAVFARAKEEALKIRETLANDEFGKTCGFVSTGALNRGRTAV